MGVSLLVIWGSLAAGLSGPTPSRVLSPSAYHSFRACLLPNTIPPPRDFCGYYPKGKKEGFRGHMPARGVWVSPSDPYRGCTFGLEGIGGPGGSPFYAKKG